MTQMTQTKQILPVWKSALTEARETLDQFLSDASQLEKCAKFTEILTRTFQDGGRLFVCGNGGSHCDALHFAEEFTGRYRKDRRPLGALALGEAAHQSCVSNDYGFEHVYSRQLEGLAREGDLLVVLSTSGKSKNVCHALETARRLKIQTVALLGRDGGVMKDLADLSIIIPANTSDRIQEMHIKIIHTVIESCERQLFPENY